MIVCTFYASCVHVNVRLTQVIKWSTVTEAANILHRQISNPSVPVVWPPVSFGAGMRWERDSIEGEGVGVRGKKGKIRGKKNEIIQTFNKMHSMCERKKRLHRELEFILHERFGEKQMTYLKMHICLRNKRKSRAETKKKKKTKSSVYEWRGEKWEQNEKVIKSWRKCRGSETWQEILTIKLAQFNLITFLSSHNACHLKTLHFFLFN